MNGLSGLNGRAEQEPDPRFLQAAGLLPSRLRRAAEALKNTPGAVAEIAADCGFADSNYFARKFRAAYGVSPREFRKRPL